MLHQALEGRFDDHPAITTIHICLQARRQRTVYISVLVVNTKLSASDMYALAMANNVELHSWLQLQFHWDLFVEDQTEHKLLGWTSG